MTGCGGSSASRCGVTRRPFPVLGDHRGRFLRDHDGGRVGVRAVDDRHDAGVGDAQAVDAADAQARIDHGHVVDAHPAGADRMEHGVAGAADPGVQVRIALDLRTRHALALDLAGDRRLAEHLAQAEAEPL